VDQCRQFVEFTRSAQHIDMREALENVRPIALRHAADHADHQVGLGRLALLQLSQSRPDLLLGMFAHRAGVVEDHICLLAILDRFIPLRAELPENQLAIEHVHLAAESLQVQLATHD
jgi:hypothetical protein